MKKQILFILLFLTPHLSFAFDILGFFDNLPQSTSHLSYTPLSSKSADYSFDIDGIIFSQDDSDFINIHEFLLGPHQIALSFRDDFFSVENKTEKEQYLHDLRMKITDKAVEENTLIVAYDVKTVLIAFIKFQIKKGICTKDLKHSLLSCFGIAERVSRQYREFTQKYFEKSPEVLEATLDRSLLDPAF